MPFETTEFTTQIEDKTYSVVVEYIVDPKVDYSEDECDLEYHREITDLTLYDHMYNDVTSESEKLIAEHLPDDVLWQQIELHLELYPDIDDRLEQVNELFGMSIIEEGYYVLHGYEMD